MKKKLVFSRLQSASKFIILMVFIALPYSALTQINDTDEQVWINYAVNYSVTNHFSYGGDIGIRESLTDQDWRQVVIRPTVFYRFNPAFRISGGMAWFGTFQNRETEVNEYRIHQDFNINWPDLTLMSFFFRVRFEERWFYYPDLPNDFNVRFRFLAGIETADIRWFGHERPIYFRVMWEAFNTLNTEVAREFFVNDARFHTAFGHRISNSFRYELHYIWQRSRLGEEEGIQTTQNTFRIRFFHRLNTERSDLEVTD